MDRNRFARLDRTRIGDDGGQREGRLLERLGLGRAETAHAHVGLVRKMLPVRRHGSEARAR